MSQEKAPIYEDDPKVTSNYIMRPEGFTLDKAIGYLKRGKNEDARVNDFLCLAAGVNNERDARYMRDRAITVLSSRGVAGEEWAQKIIAILNDSIDQFRKRVNGVAKDRNAHKRSGAKSRRLEIKNKAEIKAEKAERDAMPGVFRNVTVESDQRFAQAKVELFFGYSKKGVPIVRVHAVKSGDFRILVPGSTYQVGVNMPKVLERSISDADISFSEIMKEAAEKRDGLNKKEEAARESAEQKKSGADVQKAA
ncbi:hypothetical protein KJ657_01220 [Patescibacteria group bacterium]|nr:hypothetical protein [Patescibacteria group bacterium]MBU1015688.1 hypothetical protein [Patescibacteria group bacterium]MBU1685366.1 hypothetical protein [Patescibacteria group bacterium]MBU1938400.1 hypothetical protein [Patescibacteria group bacterium]